MKVHQAVGEFYECNMAPAEKLISHLEAMELVEPGKVCFSPDMVGCSTRKRSVSRVGRHDLAYRWSTPTIHY